MKLEPPYWADRLLRWYCNPRFLEEIEGDIYELFERRAEDQGLKKARIKFIWDVFRFFRWSNIKKSNSNFLQMKGSLLFRNYLKLGFRSIQKNLLTSSINIFSLAIAIGFAITTFIFVDMQHNMDAFHSKKERVFQIANNVDQETQGMVWSDSPILLGPTLAAENPAIEAFTRIEYTGAAVKFNNDVFDESVSFVDEGYFELFDFPFISGYKGILEEKDKVVISREVAIKYFSDEDPIGKSLSFKFYNGELRRFTVGAVLDKFPYNAGIRNHFIIPMSNYFDLKFKDNYNWADFTDATLVLLKEGESVASLTSSLPQLQKLQNESNPEWTVSNFVPIALADISIEGYNIRGSIVGGGHPGGRIALTIIAFLLLGMACFNFMNISVVSSTKRLKEIALRKVMGGYRKQVINQFLVENTLQCLIALIIGTTLSFFLFTPGFDMLVPGLEIPFKISNPVTMITFFISLLLLTGVLSGAYPAFYISKFDPISIFKEKQKFGSKNLFSKIMLGIQFFLAIVTIVGCFIFIDQSIYLGSKDWGYDPQGTIAVWVEDEQQNKKLRNELLDRPDIIAYGASSSQIGRYLPLSTIEYENEEITVRTFSSSEGYFETMNLRLKEGRFLTDRQADIDNSVVVNEKFANRMGWENPVNQTFVLDSVRKTIVGVVFDFHYDDFYSPIDPVVISGLNEEDVHYLSVRTKPENVFDLDQYVRASWNKIAPNDPFDRIFQEDALDSFYEDNKSNTTIIGVISFFSMLLACLGLYGLLSFNIQGRLKEFSLRKVLGASPKTIVKIASKQYAIIVIISFVLGAPLGFMGMNSLIVSIFPDTKDVSPLPFIIAMALIFSTMALTVVGQMKKAINVNPSENLRNE